MLTQKTIEILEKEDMTVHKRENNEGEYYRGIQFCSPKGEDVYETIFYDGTNEGFIKAFEENAESFDAEDHAEVYINMRGKNGVPESIRDLLNDADWIKNTLVETAKKLKESYIEERNEKENIKYFEVEFIKKEQLEDETASCYLDRMSMCILAEFEPNEKDVLKFCEVDLKEFGYNYVNSINELSYEEAHKLYDMEDEANFPILRKKQAVKPAQDLTEEQLNELKQSYLSVLKEDCDVSYEELIEAEKIPDEVIFNYYEGMTFTDDDFFCSANE